MMTLLPKYVFLIVVLACWGTLQGQANDCTYRYTVTGSTSVNASFLAEHKLISSHEIELTLPIYYGAGYEIFLDTGFYINQGSQLTAELEGCESSCNPPTQICDEPCTSPLKDTIKVKGQRYLKFEVIVTFPDSIDNITPQNCGTGSNYSNCLYI